MNEWRQCGPRIGVVSKGANWWLGDWVRFGHRRFDQRYRQAAELTGYDAQTLMNLAYVAGRFEISRRRENISWSHHAELAKLQPATQDAWLDRVTTEHLSIRKLRAELRAVARGQLAPEEALPAAGWDQAMNQRLIEAIVCCPRCGEAFRPDPGRQSSVSEQGAATIA